MVVENIDVAEARHLIVVLSNAGATTDGRNAENRERRSTTAKLFIRKLVFDGFGNGVSNAAGT